MPDASASLMVAVADPVVFVKVIGRACFKLSVEFKTLIQELSRRAYQRYVIDLSECLVMDSTFLGVLAGIGLKLAGQPGENHPPRMALCHPNQRICDLLDNLGVTHLFQIVNPDCATRQDFQSVPALLNPPSQEEVSRVCLDAHLTLMDINPANVPKFKEVAKFLREDLEKLQARKS